MHGTVVLPGPETVILFGVAVPVLSMIFGVGGVLLGHLIAPAPTPALGGRRTGAVVAAGILMALAITIATGQRPLVVLGWSIGIGFSGITIFQSFGAGARKASSELTEVVLSKLAGRPPADDDKGGA